MYESMNIGYHKIKKPNLIIHHISAYQQCSQHPLKIMNLGSTCVQNQFLCGQVKCKIFKEWGWWLSTFGPPKIGVGDRWYTLMDVSIGMLKQYIVKSRKDKSSWLNQWDQIGLGKSIMSTHL